MAGLDHMKTAVVLGVSADIGVELASRLLSDGWRVIGLSRSDERLGAIADHSRFLFLACDPMDAVSCTSATARLAESGERWRIFISCIGSMEPIGKFFEVDFEAWEASFRLNSTAQLRVLHGLWPHRVREGEVHVMLLAGGGTNNPMTNYSAYCAAKIALIKMCELIDDEEAGANAFIIGPGFVQTRIHEETLRAGAAAGDGLDKTRAFLATPGTSHDDIYAHMNWCIAQGRAVAGGRNFSTVHDPWREDGAVLADRLRSDPDAFRLRRRPAGAG
jgi:NAD(P)-dependent dehydrogenase (short-subunit alcohol dehydrogenase family)